MSTKGEKGISFALVMTIVLVLIVIVIILSQAAGIGLTEIPQGSLEKAGEEKTEGSFFACPGIGRQSNWETLQSWSGDMGGAVDLSLSHHLEDVIFRCNVPGTSEPSSLCVIESLVRKQKIQDGCDDIMNIGWFKFNFTDPNLNINLEYPCSGSLTENGITLDSSGEELDTGDYMKYTQFVSPFPGEVHKSRLLFEVDEEIYTWEEATDTENHLIEPIPAEDAQFWHYNTAAAGWETVNSIQEGETYALWVYRECRMWVEEDPRLCFYNHTYYADVFENMDVITIKVPVDNTTVINSYFQLLEKWEDVGLGYCNEALYPIEIKEKCGMNPLDDYYYCDYNRTNLAFKAGGNLYNWTLEVQGRYCCPEREVKAADGSTIYQEGGLPLIEAWTWNSNAINGEGACCLGPGCKNLPCIEEGGKWVYGECWFEGSPGENCTEVCESHERPSGSPYECKIPDHWERVPKSCRLQEKFGIDCSNSCNPDTLAPLDLGVGNCEYFDYDLYADTPVYDYGCDDEPGAGEVRFCACE